MHTISMTKCENAKKIFKTTCTMLTAAVELRQVEVKDVMSQLQPTAYPVLLILAAAFL